MRQSVDNLQNVQRFSGVFQINDESTDFGRHFNIKGKRMTVAFHALINYDGMEPVEIPGAFLSAIPGITNLPVADIAKMLDMSKSSFYRAKEEDTLEMDTVDKISSLMKIYRKGLEAFEGDKDDFYDWLDSRIASLGDRKPAELLKTETGRLSVLKTIDRIEQNVYG